MSSLRLEDKVALIFDRAEIFQPFAQALSESGFGKVLYHTEWRSIAPKSKDRLPGRGMPGIERVDSFFDHIDEADVLVFPAIGDGDLQAWLRKRGYLVWGSGEAEVLEFDRYKFKQILIAGKQPVGPFDRIIGMDALREYLENPENDGRFLKTGGEARGDFETRKHEDWARTQSWYRRTDMKFGPFRDEIEVLAEALVEGIELGYDGYSIDGEFPDSAMWGWEHKDNLYGGKFVAYSDMPECIVAANRAISDALRIFGCRGNYHSELRFGSDGNCYFTDPTMRCGAPPHELLSRQFTNWAEIVYQGARGIMVNPLPRAQYGFMLILRSPPSEEDFVGIDVPDDIADNVVLQHATRIGDAYYHVPEEGVERIGAALGFSDKSWQDAAKEALAVAKEIKVEELDYDHEADSSFEKIVEEAEDYGIKF